jgi:hypothetical protein
MSILAKFDRHAELMERMADTVGVDLAQLSMTGRLGPDDYRAAVFRCTGCTQPGACAEWIDGHPDGSSQTPDYCRNKAQLERLARA